MYRQSLNGNWKLRIPGYLDEDLTAQVPGSVYDALLRGGLMEDPYYRDNEDAALRLMDNDFEYLCSFVPEERLLEAERVILRAEGIDTLAKIYINGVLSGSADNMHRCWEFDVKGLLRNGENEIRVCIASPTRYIKRAYEENPADGAEECSVGFPALRKAHCMFGWDWGPRLPDAGIWRDISLIGISGARISGVYVSQHHDGGRVTLSVSTGLDLISAAAPEVRVRLSCPGGGVLTGGGTLCTLEVDKPELWWPNGYGGQPLYGLTVTLSEGERELDRWERRIGLRTVSIHREKDIWGESFCHMVNGVDIFAMGQDYVPEDSILPRISYARTRRLLEDAKAANMNVIRVWGGGFYPHDYFYDICDELGLLVWQDFMFACAVYNLTPEFEDSIRAEAEDNIRRLRHHACLALWCGNNEMELFVAQGQWVRNHGQRSDYVKMYEYILPQILMAEDPDRDYWPSSPSSGGAFDRPNDENRGDAHFWEVWHSLKPFTEYRKKYFRYVSEFGFQSFPCMETIESFTLPEDRNPFSYVMEKHQRNASANGRIASYLSQMYLYPDSLDSFVYASQLLQAQAMQYGVEHWRRHRGRCMGAVIWQLNDCWPVVSWSGIDYFGRWKASHYFARRFFAPVLLSCHEQGLLERSMGVNEESDGCCARARLNVSNETREDWSGTVRWALRKADGGVLLSGEEEVSVRALSSLWLEQQEFADADVYGSYYSYELTGRGGEHVSEGSVLFCPPKHFAFADPKLSARLEGKEIVVTAEAYARYVEIRCGADVVLEDNYFDMNAGTRRVKIIRGTPGEIRLRSVYDIR